MLLEHLKELAFQEMAFRGGAEKLRQYSGEPNHMEGNVERVMLLPNQ